MTQIMSCAFVNGLDHDTGPCVVIGIPVGVLVLVFAAIIGVIIGKVITR